MGFKYSWDVKICLVGNLIAVLLSNLSGSLADCYIQHVPVVMIYLFSLYVKAKPVCCCSSILFVIKNPLLRLTYLVRKIIKYTSCISSFKILLLLLNFQKLKYKYFESYALTTVLPGLFVCLPNNSWVFTVLIPSSHSSQLSYPFTEKRQEPFSTDLTTPFFVRVISSNCQWVCHAFLEILWGLISVEVD